MSLSEENCFDIIYNFFDHNGLVSHQIESYNNFINRMKEIIELYSVLDINYTTKKGVTKTYFIQFTDVYCDSPKFKNIKGLKPVQIFPKQCMDRDITYSSDVYVTVKIKTDKGTDLVHENVNLVSIPVMVYSNLCNLKDIRYDEEKLALLGEDIYETGGYFVVKGSPKVIACQERKSQNKVFTRANSKSKPKYSLFSEIYSSKCYTPGNTTARIGFIDDLISAFIPHIQVEIPITLIFGALGARNYGKIVEYIIGKKDSDDTELLNLLVPSLEYKFSEFTTIDNSNNSFGDLYNVQIDQNLCLEYIGKHGNKYADKKYIGSEKERNLTIIFAKDTVLKNYLCHLGETYDCWEKKKIFTGYMVKKILLLKLGRTTFEDRDHFMNKRIHTAGSLMTDLFHDKFGELMKDIKKKVEDFFEQDSVISIPDIIRAKKLKIAMNAALSTNQWTKNGSEGTSQVYDKPNRLSSIANKRKIESDLPDTVLLKGPRELHSSQYGICCIAETPEGKKCGIVKAFALSAKVSTQSNKRQIEKLLSQNENITHISLIDNNTSLDLYNNTIIFLNGDILGITDNPYETIKVIKKYRQHLDINYDVSVNYLNDFEGNDDKTSLKPTKGNVNEINIYCDHGRLIRPLFVVEDGNLRLTSSIYSELKHEFRDNPGSLWLQLLYKGYIEFLDKSEEEGALIAMFPKDLEIMDNCRRNRVTHCEIHPSLMYGVSASIIPYSDHNMGVRNAYQSAMGKQALGKPSSNYEFKMRGKIHVMKYSQKPLVTTIYTDILKYTELTGGLNAVVAIGQWKGFGQEDSLIFNKDALDRGFMTITSYMAFDSRLDHKKKNEFFEIPTKESCLSSYREGSGDKLNSVTCCVPEGTKVENGDLLIGKVVVDNSGKKINSSVAYEHAWPGVVHRVYTGYRDGEGNLLIRVVVRQIRKPVEGDKFSGMHGQKGTIGKIVPANKLFCNEEGITPDIIINPLAFPSRMTMGMTMEILNGRRLCMTHKDNIIITKKPLRFDKENGDTTNGLDDTKKCKSPKGGYSNLKTKTYSTPFSSKYNLHDMFKDIDSLGYDYSDFSYFDDIFYDAETGIKLTNKLYMGVCYYQRLKHMVIDKIHARSTGSCMTLTRQPKEGRRYGGGLKIGYMEKDAMLAHGCPRFAKDRLMDNSDASAWWFCSLCGLMAIVKPANRALKRPAEKKCNVCKTNDIVLIELPYATKLLIQEFMGMNIVPRLITKSFDNEKGEYDILVGDRIIKGQIVST